MNAASSTISVGDALGFAALIVVGLASFFMLIRSALLKRYRNLPAIRAVHLGLSILAGTLLILHISLLFSWPSTPGLALGYASFAVAMSVWVSGTAFLEKLRDSLFFHGTLASLLVALALVHGAISSTDIPFEFTQVMLASSSAILIVNALYHLRKGVNLTGRAA
jgi:hypothetical protein